MRKSICPSSPEQPVDDWFLWSTSSKSVKHTWLFFIYPQFLLNVLIALWFCPLWTECFSVIMKKSALDLRNPLSYSPFSLKQYFLVADDKSIKSTFTNSTVNLKPFVAAMAAFLAVPSWKRLCPWLCVLRTAILGPHKLNYLLVGFFNSVSGVLLLSDRRQGVWCWNRT